MDLRSICRPIQDASQVGEARRHAAEFCAQAGLDESAAGRVAILVTELGNNLHKHARDGALLLRPLPEGGVEILSVDAGPGMADVEKCFRDGYSTGGTPGNGLGAVRRMADRSDIYSAPGSGTVLLAQTLPKARSGDAARVSEGRLETGSVVVPVKGETRCGDNWSRLNERGLERIMVADGLGHGPGAAEASDEARRIFEEKRTAALPELMEVLHAALKKTRGAAAAMAEIDFQNEVVRYLGVGNISGTILHEGTARSLVSQNGTVGHEMRSLQVFQYPFRRGSVLVMASDGLQTKWDLKNYPGLTLRHPSLAAAVLWRDFKRGRDDTAVVVARERTTA